MPGSVGTAFEHLAADRIRESAVPLFAFPSGPAMPLPVGRSLRYPGDISNDSGGLVEFCCPIAPDVGEIAFPDQVAGGDARGEACLTRDGSGVGLACRLR